MIRSNNGSDGWLNVRRAGREEVVPDRGRRRLSRATKREWKKYVQEQIYTRIEGGEEEEEEEEETKTETEHANLIDE